MEVQAGENADDVENAGGDSPSSVAPSGPEQQALQLIETEQQALQLIEEVWFVQGIRSSALQSLGTSLGIAQLAEIVASLEHPVGYAVCWLDLIIGRLAQAREQLDTCAENPQCRESVLTEMKYDSDCLIGLIDYFASYCRAPFGKFSDGIAKEDQSLAGLATALHEFSERCRSVLDLPKNTGVLPGEPPTRQGGLGAEQGKRMLPKSLPIGRIPEAVAEPQRHAQDQASETPKPVPGPAAQQKDPVLAQSVLGREILLLRAHCANVVDALIMLNEVLGQVIEDLRALPAPRLFYVDTKKRERTTVLDHLQKLDQAANKASGPATRLRQRAQQDLSQKSDHELDNELNTLYDDLTNVAASLEVTFLVQRALPDVIHAGRIGASVNRIGKPGLDDLHVALRMLSDVRQALDIHS